MLQTAYFGLFVSGFLRSKTLKYCFTWWPSIPFTFCSLIMHMDLWARLADIAPLPAHIIPQTFRNTSMKGNFVVISAVLVVEKYFFCYHCSDLSCLCWVTQYSVALATITDRRAVFIGGEVISGLVLMVCPGTFELTAI